jgi:hypothetical protein
MRYRKLKVGEIIKHGDYVFFANGKRSNPCRISVGDPVAKGMYGHFRRPLKSKVVAKTTHNKRIKSTSSMRKKTRTA